MSPEGVRPIATITSPGFDDPNQNEASVIFVVSQDRSETIEDLYGRTVVANLENGFSGMMIALGEIAKHGFDPDRFFSNKRIVGRSASSLEIINEVLEHRAEVGILRQCALEALLVTHPELKSKIKVINQQNVPQLPCVRSTALYPAQTFSVTPRVSPAMTRLITQRLLNMPPTEAGLAWSIASDFQHVDELLKSLKVGPYAYLREWSLKRFLGRFWPWLLVPNLIFIMVLWHHWRTRKLLDKREKELQEVFTREARLAQEVENYQRLATVNQLSATLTHELGQPLSALSFYAGGLKLMVTMQKVDLPKLSKLAQGIEEESQRANTVIQTVRSYTKNAKADKSIVTLCQCIEAAWRQIPFPMRHDKNLVLNGDQDIEVFCHPLGVTLVFLNLLRNACDAMNSETGRGILIEFSHGEQQKIDVKIYSQGKGLSTEHLSQLGKPLFSTKSSGLGLGLSLCKTLVATEGGTIEFFHSNRLDYPGVLVQLTFPEPPHRLTKESQECL